MLIYRLISNAGIITMFSLLIGCVGISNKSEEMPSVLVIGIDGLGSHGLDSVSTPYLDELMRTGSYSLKARTVMPSVSGPAWSSMITGTTVERHGIGNNSWKVNNKILEPVFKGDHNMFPTLFGETRKHCPGAKIGSVYHWGSFGNFIEEGVCDLSVSAESEDEAIQKTCNFLETHPNLTFLQIDHVDHAGHSRGYRSEEYKLAVEKADSLVGVLIEKLRTLNMLEQTVVIITADHGGFNHGHGGATPDEMIIPFIISGKGIKPGYEINHPVFTYDLAPTVAWLFNFTLNEWVTGKPLKDAFIQ